LEDKGVASQPTDQEIFEAVQASGYLMEQEAASIIESLGFHVETNRPYQDIDEQKSRELDIWGYKNIFNDEESKMSLIIELICECKNNSNPFVFIGRPKNAKDKNIINPQEYLFPIREYEKTTSATPDGKQRTYQQISAFKYLDLAAHHYYYKLETKAVQFCKIVRSGRAWEATHGTIYDAIFYPLVKALYSRQEDVKPLYTTRPAREGWKYVTLFFPLVILHGDIYYIDSTAVPQLPTKAAYVTFARELKSKTISGIFAIDFVKMDELKNFIDKEIMAFVDPIIVKMKKSPEIFWTKEVG
jgi:hypothetical protein